MNTGHNSFDVLCALEASGQLTDTESADLREHCEYCVPCRQRLFNLRRLGMQLFLAQASKTQGERLPRGMKERFAARAASEGVPLHSRSSNGFSALGLVTTVLLLLSVVAMTLRTKPPIQSKVPDSPQAMARSHNQQSSSPTKLEASQLHNRVTRNLTIHRNQTANLASLQNRRFTFTPSVRPTFDPASEIIQSPLGLRSATRTFSGSLDLTAYSAPWKPDFKSMSPAFQIMRDLVP
jgi:hypothetical protein